MGIKAKDSHVITRNGNAQGIHQNHQKLKPSPLETPSLINPQPETQLTTKHVRDFSIWLNYREIPRTKNSPSNKPKWGKG